MALVKRLYSSMNNARTKNSKVQADDEAVIIIKMYVFCKQHAHVDRISVFVATAQKVVAFTGIVPPLVSVSAEFMVNRRECVVRW